MPAGRPSEYTAETAEQFITAYADGASIREICRKAEMPDRQTIRKWRLDYPEFSAAFARARESNAEIIEDNMASIEERVLSGEVEPQAANVVLSSQRWRARVLHPKVYGDKLALDGQVEAGAGLLAILSSLAGK